MTTYWFNLTKDKRGSYVGEIREESEIEGKVALPKGATFVVWPLTSSKRNPRVLEIVAPGCDIAKEAIMIVKMFETKTKGRYFGRSDSILSFGKRTIVTQKADFVLLENEKVCKLIVS